MMPYNPFFLTEKNEILFVTLINEILSYIESIIKYILGWEKNYNKNDIIYIKYIIYN